MFPSHDPKGTKLPSGAAILTQDIKNLFGGISAGRQTDELLRSQMADEKQAKILDTSLDIYKKVWMRWINLMIKRQKQKDS